MATTCRVAANIYVSPLGNDTNIGAGGNPVAGSNFGPKLTLQAAIAQARAIRAQYPLNVRTAPIYIILRAGTYEIPSTIQLTSADTGTAIAPLIIESYPNEQAILSAGTRMVPDTQNPSLWTVAIPSNFQGAPFSQLYVGGQRRQWVRMPKTGYYQVAGTVNPSDPTAKDAFQFAPGNITGGPQINQVLVRAINAWNCYTLQIAQVDLTNDIVTFNTPTGGESRVPFDQTVFYRLENVGGAPMDPGEWYFNTSALTLSYVPLPGDSASTANFVVPRLETLVNIQGTPGAGKPKVSHIIFQGIEFAYTDWKMPVGGLQATQDAQLTPGAVMASSVQDISFVGCKFTETGSYGLEMGADVQNSTVTGCTFENLGAGGIQIGSGHTPNQNIPATWSAGCVITNNLIGAYGQMHPDAAGIWIGYANNNTIENNDVTDGYFDGISVGWVWGYGVYGVYNNIVQQNHVWNIGQNVMSDMGGIYMLGEQPGTQVFANVVNDVKAGRYHGCGIYCDKGSSAFSIENNLVYDLNDSAMFMSWGQNLTIESNIFALGEDSIYENGDPVSTGAFTLSDNIFVTESAPYFGANGVVAAAHINDNIYLPLSGLPNLFPGGGNISSWISRDPNATSEDPGFANPQAGNFTAAQPLYLTQRGINPSLFSTAGRISGPSFAADPGVFWDPAPNPQSIPFTADFDVGGGVNDLAGFLTEIGPGQSIAVSSAEHHSGPNSLEFTDGPGVSWQPLAQRSVYISNGNVTVSLWLRAGPGSVPWVATRDTTGVGLIDGPIVAVGTNGDLYAGNANLGSFPLNTWVEITMKFGVGINQTTTWSVTVTPTSGISKTTTGLPMPSGFVSCDWFGIAGMATTNAIFYIDDVNVSYQ